MELQVKKLLNNYNNYKFNNNKIKINNKHKLYYNNKLKLNYNNKFKICKKTRNHKAYKLY